MIKNLLVILVLLSSITVSSQVEDSKKPKMNFYFNPTLNVGYNVKNQSKRNQNADSQYYQNYVSPYLPNDFTYGISAVGGYNFLPNFAVGTGLKYSYIDPNFHLMYWLIQPKFIFNPGDEAFFIDVTYGKQINSSVISNSEFWGLKLGLQVAYSKRLSQEGGLVFETLQASRSNTLFIGLSYGITIFSNKNYTVEGIE
ncbi:hypothetical protein [Chryseobacterium indoltheticum]|uniref:Outer membrane protein beta-barrel domain-containing protein n=2 Tax=Chryseobacterium indoltheticum TaxID=254 RepID=A0A381FDN1_9FLAO|nr:hypothetical protein [Chryseobacterium indoltheticum]AZA73880.1 hypothetical protein EG358_08990 [Chryseobacterium indoltheticum]SIR20247.1 hypothetical protein SAMN05421682_114105 [Chryseobacterium indoltheticum]SUX44212.1 Uncharacterised protein [Chryseobacterium indoltheticum]